MTWMHCHRADICTRCLLMFTKSPSVWDVMVTLAAFVRTRQCHCLGLKHLHIAWVLSFIDLAVHLSGWLFVTILLLMRGIFPHGLPWDWIHIFATRGRPLSTWLVMLIINFTSVHFNVSCYSFVDCFSLEVQCILPNSENWHAVCRRS
jgi:hypothetical protein